MYFLENSGLGDDAPSCTSTNCSAVSVDRFEKQPPDLQWVLKKSFKDPEAWFTRLKSESRFALTSIFNRMCQYGLWCHVTAVLKIDDGQAPIMVGDHIFNIPGPVPSVYFMSPSGKALLNTLLGSGRFCKAHGIGASRHKGQTSLREISGSDSLHISIGPGNKFDAHIDKISPVPERDGILCSNKPTAAAVAHIGREVVPEIVPGVQVFPDFELKPSVPQPEPTSRQDAGPPPPIIGVTVRGPSRKTPPRPVRDASPLLPAAIVEQIERAIKSQISPDALVPAHVLARRAQARRALEFAGPFEEDRLRKARDDAEAEASSYPDPSLFALDLAERMEHARRSRATWVKIDLPQYGSANIGNRKATAGQIGKIALIVRNFLPDGAKDVRTIVMIFGSGNVATREEVKLP